MPQRGMAHRLTVTLTTSAATDSADMVSGRLSRTRYALTGRPTPSASSPGARASRAGTLAENPGP